MDSPKHKSLLCRPTVLLGLVALCLPGVGSSDMVAERWQDTTWIYEPPAGRKSAADVHVTMPAWIVSCPYSPKSCFARSGPLVIQHTQEGGLTLHFDPVPQGCVTLEIGDYAYDLLPYLGTALNPVTVGRLIDPSATLVFEPDCAQDAIRRPLRGLDLAILDMHARAGDVVAQEKGPLGAMADAADYARSPHPKLVPDTKPQIQFAIRAQQQDTINP